VLFSSRREIIITRCQIWAVRWMFHLYKTAFGDYFMDLESFVNSAIVLKQHNLLITIVGPFFSKIPSISQKIVAINFPDEFCVLAFWLWRSLVWIFYFRKKFFVVSQSPEVFFANLLPTQLCSALSNFETQCGETLFVPKSPCKIFNTAASDIPISSAIIEILILRSAKTKSSTFLMFSLVLASTGLPHLGPSHLNCLHQNFIGKYDGASSPYTLILLVKATQK
jgi:hypothetical protein